MTGKKKRAVHNVFVEQVRNALTNYHDLAWLTEHSPLATTYFLSQFLTRSASNTTLTPGLALQQLLDSAAARLWGDTPLPSDRDELLQACESGYDERKSKSRFYRFTLLELCYFRRYVPADMYPRDRGECQVFLEIGRNPFYEHLNKTIAQLSEIILKLVQPTFRLEAPVAQRGLIGRERAIARCLDQLEGSGVAAISGAGGLGKTALGMAVCEAWAESGAVFWLTFRPKVNDSLSSVIFAFAHYLHSLTEGHSLLWQQMMADKGSLQAESVWLGLLRSDLEQIAQFNPLICFDEVELLRSGYLSETSLQQQAIISLIESLVSEKLPILLIGQQIPLVVDTHIVPDALSLAQTAQFLEQAALALSTQEAGQLFDVCRGNPRVLGLIAALCAHGEPVAAIVQEFASYPSVQMLLDRLWTRLQRIDREVLAALSVYRGSAPGDIWEGRQASIERLGQRGLLDHDRHGGLSLTPFVRQLVYSNLDRDLRDRFHLEAATVRATRGDYTAASYHFYSGGAYADAIDCWYRNMDLEIGRGHGAAAQAVFHEVPSARLDTARQSQLIAIRNRLNLLLGEAQRVLDDTAMVVAGDDEISAEIITQRADAQALLGNLDEALATYTNAVTAATRTLRQTSQIAHKKVWLRLRAGQFDEARLEANAAKCYAEFALGTVSVHQSDFSRANTHLNKALTLAQMLDDSELIPKIHRRLSTVAGHLGQIDVARYHAQQAMGAFQKIGDVFRMELMRADLAGMYLQVKNYAAVIEPAEKALSFFEKIRNTEAICATCCNLAEAWLEQGDLDTARQLALRVVQLEEPYYQPFALYTLGLVMQRSNELGQATEILQSGVQQAESNRFIRAYLQGALGRVYTLRGDRQLAKSAFDEALTLFMEMGLEQERVAIAELLSALKQANLQPNVAD